MFHFFKNSLSDKNIFLILNENMRKAIRHFLNKRNYEIIRQPYIGDKYPNLSKSKTEYYCETPIGNFYLPKDFELDAVASTLVRGKYFEPYIIDTAKKYIKPDTAVLDIGANFGQMSMIFSKLVGRNGDVFSFEAQNFVFNFLKKNIEANECKNVKLIERAVYNKDNEVLYFSTPNMTSGAPYSGNTILGSSNMSNGVNSITIDSLKIDKPISFMKIDIEGSDIFALQGAKETILKHKMPIIFEYTQHVQTEFKTSFQDYVEFVESINYKFDSIIEKINFLILPK